MLHWMHICEMALKIVSEYNQEIPHSQIKSGAWSHDTDMLFMILKNAKDSSYSWVNMFDAGTGHTYKEN